MSDKIIKIDEFDNQKFYSLGKEYIKLFCNKALLRQKQEFKEIVVERINRFEKNSQMVGYNDALIDILNKLNNL